MEKNIVKHRFNVTKAERVALNGHAPMLLWFTGLSGSGKSTVANAVEQKLNAQGIHTYTLDGDNVRGGLNSNLTFSPEDRKENIRRIAEVANLMVDAGLVVLAAFVSPYKEDRQMIREIVGASQFHEIHISTPIEVCEARDVKGLYAKARAGEILDFTGVNAPYEAPDHPALAIDTSEVDIEQAASLVMGSIIEKLKSDNE